MTLEEVRRHFDAHDTFARHLGIDIVEIGQDRAVVSMPFDERHRNGMGHAHGGAIFALADLVRKWMRKAMRKIQEQSLLKSC